MTAAGNRSAGRVNRNAAKRFDYEIATAARPPPPSPSVGIGSLNPVANVARLSATSCGKRAVEVESGAHRARLCIGPHIFRDVIVANRAGLIASIHEKPFEIVRSRPYTSASGRSGT